MDILDDAPSANDPSPDVSADGDPGPVFAADPENAAPSNDADRRAEEGIRPRCHNCGAALQGRYCHLCGQKDQDLDVRFHHLASEWLGGVFGFDARIWRTLRILFTRPGQLTLEFLAGRRVRYVPPLRLYLVASLLMLLALTFSGYSVTDDSKGGDTGIVSLKMDSDEDAAEDAAEGELDAGTSGAGEGENGSIEESSSEEDSTENGDEDEDGWGAFGEKVESVLVTISTNPEAFDRSFRDFLPQALFLMVPAFALQLRILFRRRFRRYLHHLIFSLHAHALVFFLIAITNPLDSLLGFDRGTLGDLAGLLFFVYLFMALRRMYGDGRIVTGLKMFVLTIVHSVMLSLALLGALILAALRTQGSL